MRALPAPIGIRAPSPGCARDPGIGRGPAPRGGPARIAELPGRADRPPRRSPDAGCPGRASAAAGRLFQKGARARAAPAAPDRARRPDGRASAAAAFPGPPPIRFRGSPFKRATADSREPRRRQRPEPAPSAFPQPPRARTAGRLPQAAAPRCRHPGGNPRGRREAGPRRLRAPPSPGKSGGVAPFGDCRPRRARRSFRGFRPRALPDGARGLAHHAGLLGSSGRAARAGRRRARKRPFRSEPAPSGGRSRPRATSPFSMFL